MTIAEENKENGQAEAPGTVSPTERALESTSLCNKEHADECPGDSTTEIVPEHADRLVAGILVSKETEKGKDHAVNNVFCSASQLDTSQGRPVDPTVEPTGTTGLTLAPQPELNTAKPPKPPRVERIWPFPRKHEASNKDPEPPACLSEEELTRLKESFSASKLMGAQDSDEVVMWEDILSGAAGPVEQEAAHKLLLEPITHKRPADRDLVCFDYNGYDMRIGERAKKRHRVAQEQVATEEGEKEKEKPKRGRPPKNTSTGTASKTVPSKQASQKAPTAKPKLGRPPRSTSDTDTPAPTGPPTATTRAGPLPKGWTVVVREGRNVTKPYKVYMAPNGKTFQSYAQSKAYWEKTQEKTKEKEKSEEGDRGPAAATSSPATTSGDEAKGQSTASEVGGSTEKTGKVESRRYLPAEFLLKVVTRPTTGKVDKYYMHQDGSKFQSLRAAATYAQKKNLELLYLPHDYDFREFLQQLRMVAATCSLVPDLDRAGTTLLNDAVLRVNEVLSAKQKMTVEDGSSLPSG